MKFIYACLLLLTISNSLYTMNYYSLSVIEYHLVLREISLRGLSAVCQQIENPTKERSAETVFLPIKDIFCNDPLGQDPLTITIFNKITEIESNGGYRPIQTNVLETHYYTSIKPTNYLGYYTRYFWKIPDEVIRVESHITNKDALMDVINYKKTQLNNAILEGKQ